MFAVTTIDYMDNKSTRTIDSIGKLLAQIPSDKFSTVQIKTPKSHATFGSVVEVVISYE